MLTNLFLALLSCHLLILDEVSAWWGSSSSSASSESATALSPKTGTDLTAEQLGESVYWVDEWVTEYRCFQERAEWRFYLIPHVGVRVRTQLGREYFIENNNQGTEVTKPRSAHVNYGLYAATWEWEKPTRNLTMGYLVQNSPHDYNLLTNNCYHAEVKVLGMLRPDMSCGVFRCKACGWL